MALLGHHLGVFGIAVDDDDDDDDDDDVVVVVVVVVVLKCCHHPAWYGMGHVKTKPSAAKSRLFLF